MTWLKKPTQQTVPQKTEQATPVLKTFKPKTVLQERQEAARLNSFGGLVKETIKQIPKTVEGGKFVQNIKESAKDIEQGRVLEGVTKAALRSAGDAVIEIYKPISAAIGLILNKSGGQKLVDGLGNTIADKTGITDIPAFQKFAMEHPNAGEDFNRFLNLATLGSSGKSKIDPKQMTRDAQTITTKIFSKAKPIEPPTKGEPMPEGIDVQQKASKPVLKTFNKSEQVSPIDPDISQTSLNIKRMAEDRGIDADFSEMAKIERMKMDIEAQKARDFIEQNPKEALQMTKVEPESLRAQSVFKELKLKALQEGDVKLLQELAKSKIGTATAQALKALDDGIETAADPVRALQDIRSARETALIKGTGGRARLKTGNLEKAKFETKRSLQTEVGAALPKIKTWEEFIDSIEC